MASPGERGVVRWYFGAVWVARLSLDTDGDRAHELSVAVAAAAAIARASLHPNHSNHCGHGNRSRPIVSLISVDSPDRSLDRPPTGRERLSGQKQGFGRGWRRRAGQLENASRRGRRRPATAAGQEAGFRTVDAPAGLRPLHLEVGGIRLLPTELSAGDRPDCVPWRWIM